VSLLAVTAQPLNELDYVGITPHPSRKPAKVGQRFHCECVVACVAHIAIDTVGVWPIRLHRYGGETFFLDEPLRDLGAVVVKVVVPWDASPSSTTRASPMRSKSGS
jgi:hypothetical protein